MRRLLSLWLVIALHTAAVLFLIFQSLLPSNEYGWMDTSPLPTDDDAGFRRYMSFSVTVFSTFVAMIATSLLLSGRQRMISLLLSIAIVLASMAVFALKAGAI